MPILKTLYSLLFSTHTCIWMYLDERNQVEICRPYSVPSRDALDSAHINLICPESVDIWNVVSSSVHQDIRTTVLYSRLRSGQAWHDRQAKRPQAHETDIQVWMAFWHWRKGSWRPTLTVSRIAILMGSGSRELSPVDLLWCPVSTWSF